MELDEIDFKILSMLQRDARTSLKNLAKFAGVSIPTARFRLLRLKETAVIKRFSTAVDPAKLVGGLSAFIMVKVRLPDVAAVAKTLSEMHEVSEAYLTTGQFDLVLRVDVLDMKVFQDFIVGKLGRIPGVDVYSSCFIVEALKDQVGPTLRPGFGVRLKCENCGRLITEGLIRKQIDGAERLFCSEACLAAYASKNPANLSASGNSDQTLERSNSSLS
ncbi:MAG: Lrp/AsnC ligand binding domain-containing protein [Thaumarchaeota archaeon]|nr:Lrp/AsnC ligand binding domain-containing protein [Nitrososphaerota archaeon]